MIKKKTFSLVKNHQLKLKTNLYYHKTKEFNTWKRTQSHHGLSKKSYKHIGNDFHFNQAPLVSSYCMTNENTSVKFRWHEFYFSRQLIEFLVRHNWPYKFVPSKGFVPLLSKGHFTRDTDKETIRQKTSGLRFHCISGLPPFLEFCTFYEKRNCVSPTLLSPKQTEYVFLDIH